MDETKIPPEIIQAIRDLKEASLKLQRAALMNLNIESGASAANFARYFLSDIQLIGRIFHLDEFRNINSQINLGVE